MHFKKIIFLLPFICSTHLFAVSSVLDSPVSPEISPEKRQALYHSLDQTSVSQHLAFYELYKNSPEGRKALLHAWKLIAGTEANFFVPLSFPQNINGFIALINPANQEEKGFEISKEALDCIEQIAHHLPNRKLKGHAAKTVDELLSLPPDEIDLARALLISQLGQTEEAPHKIRMYEAAIDLMALQVLAKVPKEATPREKVQALNQLIFYEMGFRFPPHSIYSNQIDLFTFLPSVLESRKGVCLGVSTLYLCLAQRLELHLEIITPPGHIYLRLPQENEELNIETTLRGVHILSDEYLSINTRALPVRNLKEVIGMAHFNQASIWLAKDEWQKAVDCYTQALKFTPGDRVTEMLYGCSLLFCDKDKEARLFFEQANKRTEPFSISPDTLIEDILNGNVNKAALKPLFLYVDETCASILKKKEALEQACMECPRFRSGLFQLAICWLQLQRPSKAIEILEKYHTLDQNDITVEFYLAELYFSRFDAKASHKHCEQAEKIAKERGYMPLALQHFKAHIAKKCLYAETS